LTGIAYLIPFLLLLSTGVQAQFSYGVKGSYALPFNRSQVLKYDDAQDFFIYSLTFEEQDVAPAFSLVGHYREELVYFQLELGYKKVRTRYTADDYIDLDNITQSSRVKTTASIDVPFFAGIRSDKLKLGVGPYFSFIVRDNVLFEDIVFFEERRSRMEMGFGFQFGLVLYRMHLELGYQYRFNEVGDYLYWRERYMSFNQPVQYLELGLSVYI